MAEYTGGLSGGPVFHRYGRVQPAIEDQHHAPTGAGIGLPPSRKTFHDGGELLGVGQQFAIGPGSVFLVCFAVNDNEMGVNGLCMSFERQLPSF